MKVLFLFRNNLAGYSIHTVFRTLLAGMYGKVEGDEVFMPSFRAQARDIIRNGIYAHKHERKGWINHITGDVHYLLYFLKGKRTVVTVHDIMYYHYLKGVKRVIWKWLYIRPLKRAAKVVFISDFSRRQVLQEIVLPEERLAVIPNPVCPDFTYTPKEFNAAKPRILHIGTLERKNLCRTVKALQGIPCHLRIIGDLDEEISDLLRGAEVEYSSACNLTHEEILAEYRKADVINFPSLYEGFGMPVIEGQATGRVVVTSDLSPMKEVAGGGAVLVDPYSVGSLREAYQRVISEPETRDAVIVKGLANVRKYQVGKIVEKYIGIYQKITEERNVD